MNARLPRMAVVTAFACLLAAAAAAQTELPGAGTSETGAAETLPAAGRDDPWAVVEPDFSNHRSSTLQRRPTQRSSPLLAGTSERTGRSWARTVGALAGVVGLIVFLAWGYRAIAGRNLPFLGKAKRPGLIEVISKVSLSARQSLCLVRVGTRMVLIGQSPESLRALDVIDDADLTARLVGEAARKPPGSSHSEFQASLEREANDYRDRKDDVDEEITPQEGRISAVQQQVTDTIRRIRRSVARV